tara:strand:- start:516 stop:827 length:312 start_codon:yes stop_codon:yes gene_type:complete
VNINPDFDIAGAIRAIDPDALFSITNEDIDTIEWRSTPIPKEDILAKITELQEAHENLDYARKRKAEYPPIDQQLDMIFHGGLEAWEDAIQTIKDKYPKPNEE